MCDSFLKLGIDLNSLFIVLFKKKTSSIVSRCLPFLSSIQNSILKVQYIMEAILYAIVRFCSCISSFNIEYDKINSNRSSVGCTIHISFLSKPFSQLKNINNNNNKNMCNRKKKVENLESTRNKRAVA